ncbi:MAG: Rieske (2Fe-2S) protein [Vulcanimicrobiaceae bacterium]
MSERYVVCKDGELAPGELRTLTVGATRTPVIVMRTGAGALHALYGRCPHQGAPLGAGRLVGGTVAEAPGAGFHCVRDGELLQCPWHAFAYDVTDGRSVADPDHLRLRRYDVALEDGDVVVTV